MSVWTWVSVTLNGASTLTTGAAVSVDPVTETLPVAPARVHSGAAALWGATDGHERDAVAMVDSATEGVAASATEDELDDDAVLASEPHPASDMAIAAAQAPSATEVGT